ncbi:MAG: type II toxin-antitoxin system Phd/YefM family antitoxin [Candidatus Methylomirabilia bacterium]
MKTSTVSIAEGKKDFSRLIRERVQKKSDVVVTRRGQPVAVIVPYDEYQVMRRLEGYRTILALRAEFGSAGLSATELREASRKELEKRT